MRKSRDETAESRRRIVESASRLLRSRGWEGAALADVMQAAGMTHGGFYKHFKSKDELAVEAARAAFAEIAARFDARAAAEGTEAARRAYLGDYLSAAHVAHPELGCPMAACGTDAGRKPAVLAGAFAEGAELLLSRLAGQGDAADRSQAIRRLAELVGAVVVARAVGEGTLRQEVLGAVAAQGNLDTDAPRAHTPGP